MDIKQHIQNSISEILKSKYQIENLTLEVQQNKTDFEEISQWLFFLW